MHAGKVTNRFQSLVTLGLIVWAGSSTAASYHLDLHIEHQLQVASHGAITQQHHLLTFKPLSCVDMSLSTLSGISYFS